MNTNEHERTRDFSPLITRRAMSIQVKGSDEPLFFSFLLREKLAFHAEENTKNRRCNSVFHLNHLCLFVFIRGSEQLPLIY